jgi:NAD(P)-dependent dehydrogenase (short-subunit alcohol dehydrogenase family)
MPAESVIELRTLRVGAMAGRLDGKVVVITGGASGIGRQSAVLALEEGASVVLGDRNGELLAEALVAMGEERCTTARIDTTHEADLERLVQVAVERFGSIDVAINAAGIGTLAPISEHPAESWREVLDVCLTGVFLSVKHEARQMLDQATGGSIINITSISGRQPTEGMAAYCSAKAGLDMFTRVSALELGPKGVRVNAIAPGFVETPITAGANPTARQAYLDAISLGRFGQPSDIARAALFLASDEAAWINGEIVVVDGGAANREGPRFFSSATATT